MQLCSAFLSVLKPPQMRSAGFHLHPVPCAFPFWLSFALHPARCLGTPTPQLPGHGAFLPCSLSPWPCSRKRFSQPSFTTPQPPHGPLPQIRGVPTPGCGKWESLLPVSQCSSLPGPRQPQHSLPAIQHCPSLEQRLRGFWGLHTAPGQAAACRSFLIPAVRGNGLGVTHPGAKLEHHTRQRQPHAMLRSISHPFSM